MHVSCEATSVDEEPKLGKHIPHFRCCFGTSEDYEDLEYLKLMRDSLACTCHRSIREDHGFSDNIASSKHRDYQIWSRWRDQGEERLQGRDPKAQSYPGDSSNLALHERLFSEVQDLVDRPAGSCCVCVGTLVAISCERVALILEDYGTCWHLTKDIHRKLVTARTTTTSSVGVEEQQT